MASLLHTAKVRPMKIILVAGAFGALAAVATAAVAQPPDGPPPQGAGLCYGQVWLPPAAFSPTPTRMVEVRPAHAERVYAPAAYRTVYSRVAAPASRRWVAAPARYTVRTRRVLVSPGGWIWERKFGRLASGPPEPGQTVVTPTGEILCKVWHPARYAYAHERVLIRRGGGRWVPGPASRLVARRVLIRRAGWTVRMVRAEYRQAPAGAPPRLGWAPVVCGGPLSRDALQRLQASLAARGYDPGPADGSERPETYAALRKFQRDHHMAVGQITVESARALGVIP